MVTRLPLRPLRWLVLTTVLVPLGGGACGTTTYVTSDPIEYVRAHTPTRLHLQLRDSSDITLKAPRVSGDSILGHSTQAAWRDTVARRISRDSVMSIVERRLAVGRTLGLVGGILGFAIIASCGSSDDYVC